MDLTEQQAQLQLLRSTHIGAVAFRQFITLHGSAEKALRALPEFYRGKKIIVKPKAQIEKEIQALHDLGGQFLFATDPRSDNPYPKIMRNLPDAPPILSALGNVSLLKKRCVAIVGARNASIHGLKIARKLGYELAEAGYAIANGFARGIDGAAHQGALEQASAIAVFASGIDHIYPPEHNELYAHTLNYGLMLSEAPFGQKPLASSFPMRNRVISGLAELVIIVEATEKSGSLITAKFAEKQQKILCALPGAPADARAKGTNALIKQGKAYLVENSDDVIKLMETGNSLFQTSSDFDGGQVPLDFNQEDFDEVITKTRNALSATPTHLNDIIHYLELPAASVNAALLWLEVTGEVERMVGNKFIIV